MGYEYQNKKAPLASLEEDFEEINDNDTGMDYEPAFFAQASGSGAEPNLDGLQQRLLAGYKADKSDELQEFRKHGYNIDELRVDKALLEDFIQELDGLPEFSDWSITSTANALMSMIESVEKMDVKALNGEQKKVMRRVIDLSRQATDVVMMAALHLPLGGALLAAREDRAALGDDAPTEEDIAEVTANLKTTRGTIKQVRLAALDLDLRIPDKEMPWPTFKEDVDRLYRSLNRLGEGKVKTVKKTLKPDKSLTEKVQAIPLRVVDMAKAAGTDTVKGLKKLPTNKEEWKGTIRQVGKLSKQAGTSIWNKGKTVRPSLNSLTARMGWAVKNTNSQALYGTQEKFLQASDEETEFRESLKLLVEQIHFAMSAYLKYSQALAATPQEEVEQRVALRQQRQAAIDKVELLEKMLEEKEAGILKEEYPGQAEKVVPFLEGMKKEMDVFWQAAAQLDSLLGSLISPAPEEEEPLFPGNKQGELIAALGKVTSAQNRLKQRVMKATLKPFDELSVDWRIARDIGRYFYARREALLGNNTPASMAQFDAAVEEVIWTQVAGDFRKTRSPRGKQMAVRASWAYREAIAGTLQHSKTVQEIVDEQDNVDTQLIKLGQKSLVGRAAFAGVSGNVGRLIAAKPRNVLIPNLGVVKVLLSPISFWNDYRKLSRAVEPGEAFSWGSYRKMAQRNAFRQAFRMLKFALPRVATTGISGVLALWALYRAGIGDTFKKALTEGITVMPVAGGLVGANKLAGAALGRGPDKSDTAAASENGETVQGGVSQNNTAAFRSTDAHNTQEDSAENKKDTPKTRKKRFLREYQMKAELEKLRKSAESYNKSKIVTNTQEEAGKQHNIQRSNNSPSSDVSTPSRYDTSDKETSDNPYKNLSEEAKKVTYLYAINDMLVKIRNDDSLPDQARQNAYYARIGRAGVTPVDIDGFKLTNTFFIPDHPGYKTGVLVNLNDEKTPYTYIEKPSDIPINLASNFTSTPRRNIVEVYGPLTTVFRSLYRDAIGALNVVRNGSEDGENSFNKNNQQPISIYALSERLVGSAQEKYDKQPNTDHNKHVITRAITGSTIPDPGVSETPVNYKLNFTWAALTPPEYLRSFARPFSTLGGQMQLVASHINEDSIETTEKKVEQAKYIGSWVDVTVGAVTLFTPTGVALNLAQSAAEITANITEGKTPDPLDVAGLVVGCIPGGKISARIGKFSKIGEKGFKYALLIGNKSIDLADLGRSIKIAVESKDPLAIYQALIGAGMNAKDAHNISRNMLGKFTRENGDSVPVTQPQESHHNTGASQNHGDSASSTLQTCEPVLDKTSYKSSSPAEIKLHKETDSLLKSKMGSNYDTYIIRPKENCANAARDVRKILSENGYQDVKIAELGFWVNGGAETVPTNHYVVMAKKDGIEIVVDLTAGQFAQYEFSGPIINTKNNWTNLWQEATEKKPRTLVKIAPVSGGLDTSTFSAFSTYNDSRKTVPNGELLKSPTWYQNSTPAVVADHSAAPSATAGNTVPQRNPSRPHTDSKPADGMSKVNLILRPSQQETDKDDDK